MAKNIIYDAAIRESLKQGVAKTVRAIKYTYGPIGRNVMIDRGWGGPNITRDGNTVIDDMAPQLTTAARKSRLYCAMPPRPPNASVTSANILVLLVLAVTGQRLHSTN